MDRMPPGSAYPHDDDTPETIIDRRTWNNITGSRLTIPGRYIIPGYSYRITVSVQSTRTGVLGSSRAIGVQVPQPSIPVGPPVNCPPLPTDVLRGTAAQYLAMGIGWPLGYVANTERRSLNNISTWYGRSGHASGLHLGIDITDPAGAGLIMGAPILAVTAGIVVDNQDWAGGVGSGFRIAIESIDCPVTGTPRLIDPETDEPLIFTHMHLQARPAPGVGTTVTRGQVIGHVGNSGAERTSSGHLHFEVSNSGYVWLPQGNGVPSIDWHRITRRVNPVFFYPEGSFVGNTAIWNERR